MKSLAVATSALILLAGLGACSSGDSDGASPPANDQTSPEVDLPTGDGSMPETPLPPDATATIAGWDITVVSVNRDATEEVLAASPKNTPPDDFERYVLAEIQATSTDPNGPPLNSGFGLVEVSVMDTDRKEYRGMSGKCGILADDIYSHKDVDSGDTVSGQICVKVDAKKLDGAVWVFNKLPAKEDPLFLLIA